jgi:hypothetical protein
MTGIESIVRYIANLSGKGVQPVLRVLYDMSQTCQEKRCDRYREYCTIYRKFVRKRGATGIESIVQCVANLIANLSGNRSATGIESIVRYIAKRVRPVSRVSRRLSQI